MTKINPNLTFYDAAYNWDIDESYHNNPFILALPPVLDQKDFQMMVTYRPEFHSSYREMSTPDRCKKVCEVFDLVTPTKHFYDIYKILERMMFNAYVNRSSFEPKEVRRHYDIALHKAKIDKRWKRTSGESFTLTADSGFGKTTMINRILDCFPQGFMHSEFKGQNFEQAQILWIKLKIPHDASRKSLADSFLCEVDKYLGTTFEADTKGGQVKDYMDAFKTIIETYKLGLLVIDELQNLSVARSGGDDILLNFFSNLTDDIGVALVLVGTPESTEFLSATFTASRRLTSAGDRYLTRFEKNSTTWKLLVRSLWKYQFVNSPTKLFEVKDGKTEIVDEKLFDEIHDKTQGNLFVLNFLFVQAQIMAMEKPHKESGRETLGISAFRKAFNEGSQLIRAAIESIISGDVSSYRDLLKTAQKVESQEKIKLISELKSLVQDKKLNNSSAKVVTKILERLGGYALTEHDELIIKNAKNLLKALKSQEKTQQSINQKGAMK